MADRDLIDLLAPGSIVARAQDAVCRADPQALQGYADDCLSASEAFSTKPEGLVDLVGSAVALRVGADSGETIALSSRLRGVADLATKVAGDWQTLDTFTDQVAKGFLAADGEPDEDGVLSVPAVQLRATGNIGYPSSEAAEEAAEDLGRRIEDLEDADEIGPDELAFINAELERGQNDPHFAEAFSNEVGVEGYVQAAVLGVDQELLGATVTTATSDVELDLLGEWDTGDSNLNVTFITQLAGPGDSMYEPGSPEEALALSGIMGNTDPPTDLAVAIANARLNPTLEELDSSLNAARNEYYEVQRGGNGPFDPPRSGSPYLGAEFETSLDVAGGYMDMLQNSQDSAAAWLGDANNLDLALGTTGLSNESGYIIGNDGPIEISELADTFDLGLADVVRTGATHPDPNVGVPLMNQSIDWTAEHAEDLLDQGGYSNPYMSRALASGWATHVDDLVPEQMRVDGQDEALDTVLPGATESNPLGDFADEGDFFSVVMLDTTAASTVYGSLGLLNMERSQSGDMSTANVLGVANGAHRYGLRESEISLTEAELEALADDQRYFNLFASGVGLIPYAGEVAGVGQIVLGIGGWDPFGMAHPTELDDIREADAMANEGRNYVNGGFRITAVNNAYQAGELNSPADINAEAARISGADEPIDLFSSAHPSERPDFKPIDEMTEQEQAAFRAWLETSDVQDHAGTRTDDSGASNSYYDSQNSAFSDGLHAAENQYGLSTDAD